MPKTNDDVLREYLHDATLVRALLTLIGERIETLHDKMLPPGFLEAVRQGFENNGAREHLKNLAADIEYLAKEAGKQP